TTYANYPNPDAAEVKLYPIANDGGIKTMTTTKPDRKQVPQKFTDDVAFSGKDLATTQNGTNRLLFVTPILKEAVHLSGLAQITVKVASSKPAANLSVWLVALPWTTATGTKLMDNVITRGWADPQNYRSLTKGVPLAPGKFYEMKFNLQPDDQIIPAGKQIGLMIFSSDKEFTLWPKAGTEITVDLNGTVLTLPVVGGAGAFAKAVN
ncbi:MAG: Xaa-Pro dipeptidyl-peptidase, partial [Proteobacteria bacterium]